MMYEPDSSRQSVTIRAIHLRGSGSDIVVEIETAGLTREWVEVIREHVATPDGEPHAVSHIVEAAGIRRAVTDARALPTPAKTEPEAALTMAAPLGGEEGERG